MNWLIVIPSILVSGIAVNSVLKAEGEKFWQKMKFAIAPGSLKVDAKLTQTTVTADLNIDNNYYQDLPVKDIFVAVFYKDQNGNEVELARTNPNSKEFIIQAKKTSKISGINIRISNLSTLKALPTLLSKPAGERFKVIISGKVKGFPFSTNTWY